MYVDYSTSDGTARAGGDYTFTSGRLEIPAELSRDVGSSDLAPPRAVVLRGGF